MRCRSVVVVVASLALGVLSATAGFAQVQVFSTGMTTPESISQAPSTFGSFGGQYFIPDFGGQSTNPADYKILVVPQTGGSPSVFAVNPATVQDGLFLPSTGWGDMSGDYAISGSDVKNYTTTPPFVHGQIYTYGADAVPHLLASEDGATFTQIRVAPAGFGKFGGQLIAPDESNIASGTPGPGRVFAVDSTGVVTPISTAARIVPYGAAFAPAGFGSLTGDLFMSSVNSGEVDIMSPDGTFTPFANIPLGPGNAGLRQLEFSPSGFIPGYGPLLFVSVSGQDRGGGALGDLVALDSSGAIIASLRTDLGLQKFNPRGSFFLNDSQMLVSDTSDPILLVNSSAFRIQATPEPSSLAMLLCGCIGGGLFAIRRRR